jgi:predicted transcriptional regulator
MPKIQIDVTQEEHALWMLGVRTNELNRELKTLTQERNQLIKELVAQGHTTNHIARLAGVTAARVSQIATGYYDKK